MERCLHCKRVLGIYKRRGLCCDCYRTPKIREQYPCQRLKEIHNRRRPGCNNYCLECGKYAGTTYVRGLCKKCYNVPLIRDCYPTKPRGCWPAHAKVWDEDVADLTMMFEEGKSDREIGAKLNRSIGCIRRYRQRIGLLRKPKRGAKV